MSLHKRLEGLEKMARQGALAGAGRTLEVHREVLQRLTDEELERYHDALEALEEREGEWAEEDLPILQRVEDLMEKVANEA